MSKMTILQDGRLKSIPAKHANILIALGKATLAEDAAETATADDAAPADADLQAAAETEAKPKRAYRRKDMQAEGE